MWLILGNSLNWDPGDNEKTGKTNETSVQSVGSPDTMARADCYVNEGRRRS